MTRVLVGVSIAAGVVLAAWLPGHQYDFVFDWLMAKAFVSGVDPYVAMGALADHFGLSWSIGEMMWVAPRTPGALLLQAPVGLVPFEWSYLAGRLLTMASAFIYAAVLARLLGKDWRWFVAAVPLVLLVWPFSVVLLDSQTGFLVGALIGLTWILGDRWSAGLPLAAAVSIKLWPWLLIPGLWLSGRRKAAVGAGVGFVGLTLAGLAFPHVTLPGLNRMFADARAFESSTPWTLHPVMLAVVGLVALLLASRFGNPYLWAIPIGLAVAPTLWSHYLVVLLVCAEPLKSYRPAVLRLPARC